MDQGVNLSYEGKTSIQGQSCDILKATYDPDTHDEHSTKDEWTFYVSEQSGYVLANLVYHPPTYAYIENIKTSDEYPLRMNLYRQTWRTDKDLNREYLRGEFWYSDYMMSSMAKKAY